MNTIWARRRWLEFREGHSIYLIFIMTFINFIVINYKLLIQDIPVLEEIFPNMTIFAIIFIFSYLPVAVIIGFWHKRTQYSVEASVKMQYNPWFARLFRILVDIETGKASEEEIKNFRDWLQSIEKGKPEDYKG